MTSYIVIQSNSLSELELSVKERLYQGWKCQGGVSVLDKGSSHDCFYQAMIKEE